MDEQKKEAMKTELAQAAKTAVGNTVEHTIDTKKKKAKRKMKRRVKRIIIRVLFAIFLVFAGCMIGIHRNVILAYILEKPLPKAPDWHFWCRDNN